MAEAFLYGNGGSNPLNFRVIGNPQPQNPKENTIWINTDANINSYAFAATEHDAMRSGINRITRPYATSSGNKRGVVFTANDDGTITANGTNDGTGLSQFVIKSITLPYGTYYLTGCSDASDTELMAHTGSASLGRGKNVRFTLSETQTINVYYQIVSGGSVKNAVCNPVLCRLDGMVWITTGTSGNVTFNALKKNGIHVYPISAKLFVSGSWVAKTAEIWQSSAWKGWIRHLYNKGDECVSLTGGWTSYKQGDSGYNQGSCVKGTTGITISCNSLQAIATRPVNMIDLTNVSTIELEASNVSISSGNPGILAVSVVKASGEFANGSAAAQMNIDASGKMSLDVSNLSGAYYIIFCAWNWSGSGTIQGTLNEMGLLG
jgi:hypothetical protein